MPPVLGDYSPLGDTLMTLGAPWSLEIPACGPVRSGGQCTQALGKSELLPQALELLQLLDKASEGHGVPRAGLDQLSVLSLGEAPSWEMPETQQVSELL